MAQQQSTLDAQAFMAFIQQPEQAARRWELHDGEAHVKMPSLLHGLIAATILAWLQRYLDAHPLGLAAVEALHHLPDDPLNARQPDLSLYPHEQLVGANWEAPLPFLPALAIEVQSLSNTNRLLRAKADCYLARGSRAVWLFYSSKRRVEVYTLDELLMPDEDDALEGGDLLPDFRLPVQAIFDLKRPD
jgi:Uma2 family endonuclease